MKKFMTFISLIFLVQIFFAQNFTAKVIRIKDGDTVVILWENHPQTVRLAHIDCPEKNQAFGAKAKQFASDFCLGKMVEVVIAGKPDRNGRWIAEIFYNNQNIGKALLRNGLAWHFKKYSKDAAYAELEILARKKKIGLWQDAGAVAPWEFRKMRKKKSSTLTLKNAA